MALWLMRDVGNECRVGKQPLETGESASGCCPTGTSAVRDYGLIRC